MLSASSGGFTEPGPLQGSVLKSPLKAVSLTSQERDPGPEVIPKSATPVSPLRIELSGTNIAGMFRDSGYQTILGDVISDYRQLINIY